ncbi:MAG TPA: DUF6580 family putative transport protein [Pseudolabrys sp.]|nr:DUF6580 family putative transport protein [Pseudolabrys sp.]
MPATPSKSAQPSNALWGDLALMAFLIGLGVVTRLLPHALGFLPVAASALFAGRMLRIPALAIVVPVAAMALSGLVLGFEDWRVLVVVYAALALPAVAGILSRRWSGIIPTAGVMVACSLVFFAASNFAVWAFSGMYSLDMAGLTQGYIAALPFLQNTIAGDLFWSAVLFGGAFGIRWAIQNGTMLAGRAQH